MAVALPLVALVSFTVLYKHIKYWILLYPMLKNIHVYVHVVYLHKFTYQRLIMQIRHVADCRDVYLADR